MQLSYATVKNTKRPDKPNEDAVLCDADRQIYILLDGVSRDASNGIYPVPSPAVAAAELLCDSIYKALCRSGNADMRRSLRNAIEYGNIQLSSYNTAQGLQSFPAGAVGIVSCIRDHIFFYAYIGDCYGRSLLNNQIRLFTTCQTAQIEQHKSEFTADEIRNQICNHICHPYGYGVLNGDPQALAFVRYGQIPEADFDSILLSSDGMEYYLSACDPASLAESSAQEILDMTILHDNERKDDRSIIKIDKRSC